jgi:hypothetical protein
LRNNPSGSPASSKACWKRSPASRVCVACFSVDGGQVGIVPGRDDHDHAQRLAPDHAAEGVAILDHHWRQRFASDIGHVVGAFLDPADLAAIADRAAHLPGNLGHDLVVQGAQPGDPGADQRDPLGQWPRRPVLLRRAGLGHSRINIGPARHRAFHIDLAIDRRDEFQGVCHISLMLSRTRAQPPSR